MTIKLHAALKSTLAELAERCNDNVLCYGKNKLTQASFCHPISIKKATKRFLLCTRIEIHGIGFYTDAESHIVDWLKNHIRFPTNEIWGCLASPHNWIKYNVGNDLSILNIGIANTDYYILLRKDLLFHFRSVAFNKH